MTARAFFEPLRRLGFAGISGTYAVVGDPFDNLIRAFCITNTTDGDMIFSLDNTNADGDIFVPAGGFILIDVQANINPRIDDKFVLAKGEQMYVKQYTAPTSGDVWLMCLY